MLNSLLHNSRHHYMRFYRMTALAVILMMAVLTGSLLLGDSVRGTLTDRVSERLGNAETVIATGTNFLSEDIMHSPLLSNASAYLLVDGFISGNDRLIPVYVWGTDNDSIGYGEAIVNEKTLSAITDSTLSLHLPSHTLVPSGSLFVTKSYATQMRLGVVGVKDVSHGGNILLRNEQSLPLNVFVNRQQLAEVMELEGKVNIILSPETVTEAEFAGIWNPELSGIHIKDTSLTTDRIFIQDEIVRKSGARSLCFSYLVNEIIHGTDTVPYSFVTAVSEWNGQTLKGNDIILADYTAGKLRVGAGDSVRMSYFLSSDLKNLETRERKFRVHSVVPLSQFEGDSLLMAEFPGLSNVEKCTDWDSDLPIRMDHIHKDDEDFWYKHRQTPKALVSYDAVKKDWCNSFGTATALILTPGTKPDLSTGDAGIIIRHPRKEGITAAQNGTDFGGLFIALGFFIILSAILLMQSTITEMLILRRPETDTYSTLGFTERRIRRMLFREAFVNILIASPVGVILGAVYSGTILWLLGNVWSGATHTEGFSLHVSPLTVIISWATGMLICTAVLYYSIRGSIRQKQGH